MGHRHDDRSSRMGGPRTYDSRHGRGHEGVRTRGGGPAPAPDRGEPGRVFDRNEDMGGAGWSGASGRGGMSYDHPGEGGHHAERGYGYGRAGESGYGGGYGGEGSGYGGERRYAAGDEGVFIRELGYGHVPGQRWSGGYGGDRDRDLGPSGPPDRDYAGRGFTGSDFAAGRDFGGLPRQRDRAVGAPADQQGYGYRGGSDMGMGVPHPEDRGPHYGKGPKGYKRSDDRTREEVCEAIAHQGHIDASDVEVKVAGGIVTLSGTVAQRHHKRALEHLVEHCRGVDDVHNELRLKKEEPAPQRRQAGDVGRGDGDQRNGKSKSS